MSPNSHWLSCRGLYPCILWCSQVSAIHFWIGPWWRHQMETFSALLAICAGNSPVTGEFPTQRPVTRSFDVVFDLRLNKRLSKQGWGWWFETPSRPLWRHCNNISRFHLRVPDLQMNFSDLKTKHRVIGMAGRVKRRSLVVSYMTNI